MLLRSVLLHSLMTCSVSFGQDESCGILMLANAYLCLYLYLCLVGAAAAAAVFVTRCPRTDARASRRAVRRSLRSTRRGCARARGGLLAGRARRVCVWGGGGQGRVVALDAEWAPRGVRWVMATEARTVTRTGSQGPVTHTRRTRVVRKRRPRGGRSARGVVRARSCSRAWPAPLMPLLLLPRAAL